MKPTLFHFVIELPGTGMGLFWIGGGLKRSKRPGFVWLNSPKGEPVFEAPRAQVYPTTPEDTAKRFIAERRLFPCPPPSRRAKRIPQAVGFANCGESSQQLRPRIAVFLSIPPHRRELNHLPSSRCVIRHAIHFGRGHYVNLRQNGRVLNSVQKADQCEKMALPSTTEIIDRPTRSPGECFHIRCNRITRLPNDNDVHGLLVSEGEVRIRSETIQNGENVKFTSEVGIVGSHTAC